MEYSESDIFVQIKLKYNTFTKSYKKLADFVSKDPDFFLNNSISEVAIACSVAEATISRFCRTLGYNGYHDFKMALVKALTKDENILNGSVASNDSDDSITNMSKEILTRNIEALNDTFMLLESDKIEEAVNLLKGANRIMFFGVGSSLTSALEGANKFMRICPNVQINIETHMQLVSAALISENDVAIIISYSGSTKEVVDMARKIKEKGAKIICITRYQKSPLTSYSDVVLLCSSNERFVYGHSVSMEITQMFLLDILYTEFFHKTQNAARSNLEDVSSVLTNRLY